MIGAALTQVRVASSGKCFGSRVMPDKDLALLFFSFFLSIRIHRPRNRVFPQFHNRLDNPSNCYFNNFEEELFRDNALLTPVLGLLLTGLLSNPDLGIMHHTQAQYPIRHEGTNKTNLRLDSKA